ncbi:methyltransferase domain-containing protein [Paractinoplanes lichenicola]|uniref:50S ribosomal protein L11 methyltransferase n=1 Tax=Paractinoplanes lichenicola TaxID=2802976 RepID=A0ABS1W0A5_9ACTN|nr:methyltransferase domain-containing protein [Actinoplanes lichenicola]MBL7260171.1 50S ribosomal protein L11 methyltransferase [Actinoplanes lichenicola]
MRSTRPAVPQISRILVDGEPLPVRSASTADDGFRHLFIPSTGEYPVYDEAAYQFMLNDRVRSQTYERAVAAAAPGQTVLDIGTGQDAVWAIHSARAGARKVYAVERIPEAAEKARRTVAEAGFADVIEVVEGESMSLELPEPIDVSISEIIGTIGGSEGAAAVLDDVRRRLLRPGGLAVPHHSVTTIAAVDLWRVVDVAKIGFEAQLLHYVENIFGAVGKPFDVRVCLNSLREAAAVSEWGEVEYLDYQGVDNERGSDHRTLTVTREGAVHGLALGLRLTVTPQLQVIDSIAQYTSWLPVFAPLFSEGVPVRPGDRIELDFSWQPSSDGIHPDYRITGEIRRSAGAPVAFRWDSPHHDAPFRAGDFYRYLFPESF